MPQWKGPAIKRGPVLSLKRVGWSITSLVVGYLPLRPPEEGFGRGLGAGRPWGLPLGPCFGIAVISYFVPVEIPHFRKRGARQAQIPPPIAGCYLTSALWS